jgi:hypothetical protein
MIRDAAVRMQQAAAGDPATRAIFDERVAAIEAETRSAQWRLRGIDQRIADLTRCQDTTQKRDGHLAVGVAKFTRNARGNLWIHCHCIPLKLT